MAGDVELPEDDSTPAVPPAWVPASLYDFEAAGDDPALEPTAEVDLAKRGETHGEIMANRRGETENAMPVATFATWIRHVTSPRGETENATFATPGRHVAKGVAHLTSATWRWATDKKAHPDFWKLEELRPVYAQKPKDYDERAAVIAADMDYRMKVLVIGGLASVAVLIILFIALVLAGAFLLLAGAVIAMLATSSATGRHVAKKDGESVAIDVAEVGDATDATPIAMGREELEAALRLTGSPRVLGPDETVAIRNPQPHADGWSVEVTMPPGRMARQVLRARHDLAGNLGTIDRLVHLEPSAGTNRGFTLRRFTSDPFDRHSADADLLDAKRCSVWKPFPVARTLEGEVVMAGIINGAHWLFGGGTGSGKSQGARLIALAAAKDPNATGVVFDPQRSTAWGMYHRIFEVFQGSGDDDIRAMARRADWLWRVEMERRGQVISRYALEYPALCPDDKLTPEMAANRKLACPFMVVFFEEAHSLFASTVLFNPSDPDDKRTCGQVIQRAAKELVTRARRVGFCVVGITQKPSGKNVDTDIRDIFPTRSCGACRTEAMAKMVLGDDFADQGMEPTALVEDTHAGWHYIYGSGLKQPRARPWVLARYGYVDNNQLRPQLVDAEAMRREVRPELLPAQPEEAAPAPAPEPAEPVTALAPDDPGHLAEIEAVFGEGEQELHSATIIARLRERCPGRYDSLTPAGMNAFLRRIDPSLRTANVRETVDGERKQAKGLRLSVIIDCYDQLVNPGTGDDA